VIGILQGTSKGLIDGKLYKEVGNSREYLIYTEWRDFESFKEFTTGRSFREVQNYGKNILETNPRHRVFREESF